MSTYKGKPRYRYDAPVVAKPQAPEPAEEPRKRCPRCGTTYTYGPSWQVEDVPHATKGECIEALRDRLEEIERKLERHNF